MDDDVGVDVLEDGLDLVVDGDAERVADAGGLAEVAAGLRGVGVDGGDDLDLGVREARPHDLGADGADAVVDCAYLLLLHVRLHVPGQSAASWPRSNSPKPLRGVPRATLSSSRPRR